MISEIIYKVLQDARDDLVPLEVEDLVRNACSYRNYLKLLEEDQNQRGLTPQQILLHASADNFRTDYFQEWLAAAFGENYIPPEEVWYQGTVLIRYEGLLSETPIFLETIEAERYKAGVVPKRVQNIVAARAHLLGYDDAFVVMMDQNTQGWNAWHMVGDFTQAGEIAQLEVNYLRYTSNGSHSTTGIASECEICPFDPCDVDSKLGAVEPFPRVKYSLTRDSSLINELEKHLWSLNEEKTGRKRKVIHPSEITTSKCDRKIAYGLMGIKERRSVAPKLRRIFDMGNAAHDIVQMAVVFVLGESCELEAACPIDHLKIFGRCDIALEDDTVEIKTMSYKGHDPLRKPQAEHERQNTIYGIAQEKNFLSYIYINKNTGLIKEFRTKLNRQRWHKIATRASRIVKAVGEGDLPDKINKKYLCGGCKYAWYCKPEIIDNRSPYKR